MRYAIISDIHANLVAWDQVLADIRTQAPDVLVCLGDVVGYGPKPEEVLNGIRAVTDNFIMGNHDAAAAGVLDYSCFSDHARHAIDWTAEALSEESREFLATVPLAIESGDILFVHGEICEPARFHYIDGVAEAEENFAASGHYVTFIGHTHHPKVFKLGTNGRVTEHPDHSRRLDPASRYIVNVGSVGDPRNPGDLRARYVIYDSDTREVDFRSVMFSVPAYQRDMSATSLQVAPYFLHVFDQLTGGADIPVPDAGHALEEDAPAGSAAVSKRRRPARLRMGKGSQVHGKSRSTALRSVAIAMIATAAAISLLVWTARRLGKGSNPATVAEVDDPAAAEPPPPPAPTPLPEVEPKLEAQPAPIPEPGATPAPVPDPVTPPPPVATTSPAPKPVIPAPQPDPPKKPRKPATRPDPTIAWWRMEPDSAGGPLVDALENHPLPVQLPGSEMAVVAPPVIPGNDAENTAALRLGVWTEAEPAGIFNLRRNRSFTLEGWVLTSMPTKPIFVAGTRSGDAAESRGWHIDIRPPSKPFGFGQMSFFYDNGPGIVQALGEDLMVADLKPHHFAAVWDHAKSSDAGEMRLYLDGELVASTRVPRSGIAKSQANPFRIGSLDNPPRIALDEVRFSLAALRPLEFLRAEPQTMNKSGPWATATNWSGGAPPSGRETAVIGRGVNAQVNKPPPPYGGDLVLLEKATLRIETKAARVIPPAPARIILHDGASITTVGKSVYYGLIELQGKATIAGGISTQGHHGTRDFDEEISGPGTLTLDGVNNNTFHLNAANSFSGGLVALSTQKQGFHISADAPGSLGTGDVTVEAHATLHLTEPGAINGKARLILTGEKSNCSATKLILDADNTAAELYFDGVKQGSGTWGAVGSGGEHEDKRISGKGILAVGG